MEFVADAPEITEELIQSWTIGPDPVLKNRVIDDIIHYLSRTSDLGPSTLFKYRLCLDEAVTNAITHGCRGIDGAEISVEFHCSPERWAVRIVDPGPGFESSAVPDPADPGNEYRESGRGILILQRYTDKLVYSAGGREQVFWVNTAS